MPNKKFKPNKFNVFWSKLSERRRVSYQEAEQEWRRLSECEKKDYEIMAAAKKQKLGIHSGPRLPNGMQQLSEFEQKRQAVLRTERAKAAELKSFVEEATADGRIDDAVFYVIGITSFYEDARDIFPCELAMAKFSLRKGLHGDLHVRINPGMLPLGSAYTAMERSRIGHKYPLPSENNPVDEEGESNYILILHKILSFMHPFDGIPMIFAEGHQTDNHEALFNTQRALQKIFREACEYQIAHDLKVYSISDLLFYLRKSFAESTSSNGASDKTIAPFESPQHAHGTFKNVDGCYQYEAAIKACNYHHDMDVKQHCSLAKVRRHCYILCCYCANKNKYELKPECHCPSNYTPN